MTFRRWVIKMLAGMNLNLEEIIGRESELVEKIAEVESPVTNYIIFSFLSLSDFLELNFLLM